MPIEETIIETVKRFTFDEKLPEFIDRAKYLEERLKEGQKIFVEIKGDKAPLHIYAIHLEIHELGEYPRKIIYIDTLGKLRINKKERNLFKDYKPSPESQRE